MNHITHVRPSLLAANFLNLENDIKEMEKLNVTHCHFDVMDGSFVENISFGENLFKTLHDNFPNINFDVHLMTVSPLNQAFLFAQLGCKEICFHYEALSLGDIPLLNQLRDEYPNIKIGLSIKPNTDVDEMVSVLSLFDYFLIMSVEPGKGGQKYIEGSELKIKRLDDLRNEKKLNFYIGVDGGINEETGRLCLNNGCDFLVCGSSYFKAKDKKSFLQSL